MRLPKIEQDPIQSNPKNPILKALNNPKSRSAAIAAKCADCVGCNLNHLEPGFRTTIRECELYHCPLHTFRPYTSKTAHESTQSDVRGVGEHVS
jgi:hypothetical protein